MIVQWPFLTVGSYLLTYVHSERIPSSSAPITVIRSAGLIFFEAVPTEWKKVGRLLGIPSVLYS